ncbi:hypothetical protein VZT92_005679 [Zoarces viviparus]|uniref:Uncharacterized protein n=1 Tax=Zoarces viviparus TaxID=48416 RepID=A0AAW1FTC6_ZOAVI
MSMQSQGPEVVLDYEECGHADVSQRPPFKEEKGGDGQKREPAKASSTSQRVWAILICRLLSLDKHPQPQKLGAHRCSVPFI